MAPRAADRAARPAGRAARAGRGSLARAVPRAALPAPEARAPSLVRAAPEAACAGAGGAGGGVAGAGGVVGRRGRLVGRRGRLDPVPPALAVPLGRDAGRSSITASGAQIYTCTASGGAARARMRARSPTPGCSRRRTRRCYDAAATQVGTHGAGPEWTSTDGSVVNGAKAQQVNAPVTGAIPWLLLRASSTTGTGVFKDVTYVQRLNTSGGVAPATGCDAPTSGTDTSVAYTADYYFYTGGGAAAWLTPPSGVPTAHRGPGRDDADDSRQGDRHAGLHLHRRHRRRGWQQRRGHDHVRLGAQGAGRDPLRRHLQRRWGRTGSGPEWTSTDGSVVNGSKVAGSGGNATDVAWLLLKASSTTGTGVFTNVTYVQRLNTAGGSAPATGCSASTVNTETSVAYSADYYFYTGTPTDGGTGG